MKPIPLQSFHLHWFYRLALAFQITWRRHAEIHPLTIGMFTFAPDTRITVDYNQRTNEWSLIIQDIKPSDEGIYHCAISTKDEANVAYDIRLNVKSKSQNNLIT